MRIIAFIERHQTQVIEKILRHCRLGEEGSARGPSEAPASAVYEALKPHGMVQIHPYVLIKLRDDPRLLETALAGDRASLLRSWRASKLAAMATPDIEAYLHQIGAPYQRPWFIELTQNRYSAWSVAEEWRVSLPRLRLGDGEFLGLAACELWRRFSPERPSLEMIDDWICEGYGYLEQTIRAVVNSASGSFRKFSRLYRRMRKLRPLRGIWECSFSI